MKIRKYAIALKWKESNLSGHNWSRILQIRHTSIKPTVSEVKETIARLFPDYSIDTRYATVKEQIDFLPLFSVDLTDGTRYDFGGYCVEFMEL